MARDAANGVAREQGAVAGGVLLALVGVFGLPLVAQGGKLPLHAQLVLALRAAHALGLAGLVEPGAELHAQAAAVLADQGEGGAAVEAVCGAAGRKHAVFHFGAHGEAAVGGAGRMGGVGCVGVVGVRRPLVLQAEFLAAVELFVVPAQLGVLGAGNPLLRRAGVLQPGGAEFGLFVAVGGGAGLARLAFGLEQPHLALHGQQASPLQGGGGGGARLGSAGVLQGQVEIKLGVGEDDVGGAGGVVEVGVAAKGLAEHDAAGQALGGGGVVGVCQLVEGLQLAGEQGRNGRGHVGLHLQRAQKGGGGVDVAHDDEGLRVVELGAQVLGLQQQGALQRFNGTAGVALLEQPLAVLPVVGGAAQALRFQVFKVTLGLRRGGVAGRRLDAGVGLGSGWAGQQRQHGGCCQSQGARACPCRCRFQCRYPCQFQRRFQNGVARALRHWAFGCRARWWWFGLGPGGVLTRWHTQPLLACSGGEGVVGCEGHAVVLWSLSRSMVCCSCSGLALSRLQGV